VPEHEEHAAVGGGAVEAAEDRSGAVARDVIDADRAEDLAIVPAVIDLAERIDVVRATRGERDCE
jgi:hypothetical protein